MQFNNIMENKKDVLGEMGIKSSVLNTFGIAGMSLSKFLLLTKTRVKLDWDHRKGRILP